jgi:hypothetical protein
MWVAENMLLRFLSFELSLLFRRPPKPHMGQEPVAREAVTSIVAMTLSHIFGVPYSCSWRAVAKGRTAGRQARAGKNVPRTASPGLAARRWRSA